LTCKQILLEGFAEFHQRSVWHFKIINDLHPNEYIFPLVTPALMREQYLTLQAAPPHHSPWYRPPDLFDINEYVNEDDESPGKVSHILSPKSSTMAVVNLMTASAEAHDAVAKIKINLHLGDRTFNGDTDTPPNRFQHVNSDRSKLDWLAVRRRLRNLEINVTYRAWSGAEHPERLEKAFANLMVELDG
jgi:hypothetical protein